MAETVPTCTAALPLTWTKSSSFSFREIKVRWNFQGDLSIFTPR
jgi:hypothetical protein